GDGKWVQTAGGWSDAQDQLAHVRRGGEADARSEKAKAVEAPKARPQKKLSFKDEHRQKEIDALIPALHAEIAKLEKELADPALYARDPKAFNAKSERIGAARAEAEAAEMEWLDIEERREALAT
ncbi:MAG: elongation factor 3, partial [Hyphomonas sp. BRH_c22]